MEERDSQERNEGAHYKQTKTARCVVERREAVKLGCNGKGYFNILFYGYPCQYYLREGESEAGGKGCGAVEKANKLQRVQIPGSFRQREQTHKWQTWLVASWKDTDITGFAATDISLLTPNGVAAPAWEGTA